MGITHKDYLENIYGLIFTPIEFFNREDVVVSVRQAVGTMLWVSLFCLLGQAIADNSLFGNPFLPFSICLKLIGIFCAWFLTGVFFEYCAKIFGVENRLSKILFYTAFATIPYIFYAPLDVVKQSGDLGYTFGVLGQTFLYFWIIILYAMAVRKAYDISFARSFMLILLPFIGTVFAITWAIFFFVKLGYINAI